MNESNTVRLALEFKRGEKDDFALYATDDLGAEILGILYDRWESDKLNLGSFGPAGDDRVQMLIVHRE